MDYLCNEMNEGQKKEFEKKLKKNPELRKELAEMQSMQKLLDFAPMETPPQKLVMMPSANTTPETGTPSSEKSFFRRYPGVVSILTAAACLLMILLSAALADLQAGKTDQGFYLSFGEAPVSEPEPVQQGMTREEVHELMGEIRKENSVLFASMIEQMQDQQNEQLEEAISVLTDYYDQRRQQDLQLIAEGLSQLEENTYTRLNQTDETLGDLIYALSYTQYQSPQD